MGFFSWFHPASKKSVLAIDIDSASIGGAYTQVTKGKPPRVYFTARLPIETSTESPSHGDLLRTLQVLLETLVTAGAPVLQKETGSGSIDQVLISIGSPWQETTVVAKTLGDNKKSFVFTREMMELSLKEIAVKEGRVSTGNMVIAMLLNGYETKHPFGKHAKRADLVVLSSTLPKETVSDIEIAVRSTYHTDAISFCAFASVAYTVFRDLYPHEKDFLIFDFSGDTTTIVFVKGSILVDVASLPIGAHRFLRALHGGGSKGNVVDLTKNATVGTLLLDAERAWVDAVSKILKDFTTRHALPRTAFLIGSPEGREVAKKLINNGTLHALWLSDEPLRVLPVLPSQFSTLIETRGSASGDATLALLALYFKKHFEL